MRVKRSEFDDLLEMMEDMNDRIGDLEEKGQVIYVIDPSQLPKQVEPSFLPEDQEKLWGHATGQSNHNFADEIEEPPSIWFFEGKFWLKDRRVFNGDPVPGADEVVMNEGDPGSLSRGTGWEGGKWPLWIMREAQEFSAEGEPGFLDGDLVESGEIRPARKGADEGQRDWFLQEGEVPGIGAFKQPLYNAADNQMDVKILIPRDVAMVRAINVETDWEARAYELENQVDALEDRLADMESHRDRHLANYSQLRRRVQDFGHSV